MFGCGYRSAKLVYTPLDFATEGPRPSNEKQKNSDTTRPSNTEGPILDIRLLGERNSGTNWITAVLEQCFPTIKTSCRLTRWKHWFQDDGVDGKVHNRTLVVAQFRDPYDWSAAMRKQPHHSPSHLRKHWKDFMTKTWTTTRPASDRKYVNESGHVCQEHFKLRDIISCEAKPKDVGEDKGYSSHQPIYEMRHDGSGEPYNNILELRAAKIYNHLSVKEWPWVADVIILQYERLLAEGTGFFLKQIEDITGVKPSCEPTEPQPKRKRRQMELEWVQHISDNADWEAEELIGYHPAVITSKGYSVAYSKPKHV